MKLHLPFSLRKALLATLPMLLGTLSTTNSSASMMRDEASITTYTDFGQNMGRYVVGDKVNDLLQYIRDEAGGAVIEYKDGTTYVMVNGMVDFSSAGDAGHPSGLTDYGKIVTVRHNSELSPMFSSETGIRYRAIEFRSGTNFLNASPIFDFKVSRLSKIVTDVEASPIYSGAKDLAGQQLFHTGGGWQYYLTDEGWQKMCGPYQYNSGGVDKVYSVPSYYGNENQLFIQYYMSGAASSAAPLPYLGQTGDSGSSFWVWNSGTQQYEYAGTYALLSYDEGGGDPNAVGASALDRQYMAEVNAKYTSTIATRAAGGIRIDSNITEEATLTDVINNVTYTGVARYSEVTDTEGNMLGKLYRLRSGLNTWSALNDVKDRDNWYAENGENGHLLVSNDSAATSVPTRMDLFLTKDSLFTAASAATYTLELTERVDTGIGAAQFSLGDGVGHASFVLKTVDGAAEGMLNTAGYIVDEGVDLHLQFTNPENYMREWRKVGAGDLYIDGNSDTNAMLNLGGSGKVYLNQHAGHAAYNVLANTEATVVLQGGTGQIARDFTFGNGRSYLDFYGHDMEWNNSSAVEDEGFHIHALTEEGRITNSHQDDLVTITVTDGGDAFSGSFVDDQGGALKVVYQGVGEKTWQLTSIHTDLSHHEDGGSGFEVKSGSVRLGGTNTVHATGSLTGKDTQRYTNENDWHYADAKMDVTVSSDATFTLGSHARLSGDVTVNANGTLVLEEGVRYVQEYVEGSIHLEDTSKYRDYYGLKGDIANNGSVQVRYSAGTNTDYRYEHDVTGTGTMHFDLGLDGGTFTMTGTASSGKKTVASGGVMVNAVGLGSVGEMWLVEEKGFLAVLDTSISDSELKRVDTNSKGILALTMDQAEHINTSSMPELIIGALKGHEVTYGAAEANLAPVNGDWMLGGGGGTLIVTSALQGDGTLVVGNQYATGSLKLTNTNNNVGTIKMTGAVTLEYTGTVGSVEIGYSSRIAVENEYSEKISENSTGVFLVDGNNTIDMSANPDMAVGTEAGATLETLTVADGAAYRFGGVSNSTLTVTAALEGGHDLVVDNQTYAGGVVELGGGKALTGDVTVRGYDESKTTNHSGEVTLKLMEEDTLTGVSSVNIKDGGGIDVNGYNQQFDGLQQAVGGRLEDNTEGKTAEVTLTGATILNGESNLGTVHLAQDSTLEVGGNATFKALDQEGGTVSATVTEGGKLKVNGTMTTEAGEVINTYGPGTFEVTTLSNTGGTVNIDSNARIIGGGNGQGGTANQQGLAISSSVNIKSNVTEVTGAVYMGGSSGTAATLSIGQESSSATLVTTRFEMGDTIDSGTQQLNIAKGSKLVVTGGTNNDNTKQSSLFMGEWNVKSNASIAGELLAKDAILYDGDSVIQLDITGTMAVKGIEATKTGKQAGVNINLEEGGRLILGSSGIMGSQSSIAWNINLKGGEVAMSNDSTEIRRAVNLAAGKTTTFNTDVMNFSGSGAEQTVQAGDTAGVMTLSDTVNGDATTAIAKTGAGMLAITADTKDHFAGSVEVKEGIMNMFNQTRVDLKNLTIAEAAVLGAYNNNVANKINEVTLNVGGMLTAEGKDAQLNADLVLGPDATLAVYGTDNGLTMGRAVTFGGVLNLGDLDMQAVEELTFGQTYYLFNGVESFTLDEAVKTDAYEVAAKDWIKGLDDTYKLVYSGSEFGMVGILRQDNLVPEPATGTLSLLALMALAARRRRRK